MGLPRVFASLLIATSLGGAAAAQLTGYRASKEEQARQLAKLTPEYQKLHGCGSAIKSTEATSTIPLIEGLAPVHVQIKGGALAQRYFNQGIALMYGFEFSKAERSFQAAIEADPGCAMCRWGLALAMGPHLNSGPMPPERSAEARRLLNLVLASPNLTPLEHALAQALLVRYGPGASPDEKGVHARSYAAELGRVARQHPRNDFVAVSAAEAAMNARPWDYWEAGGKQPLPLARDAKLLLESVLARSPDHPQALHLYIHLTEASAEPGLAEPAADRLRKIAPRSAHLQHMPGHTYYRIGRFADAVAANKKAVRADEAMARRLGEAPLFYNYFRHHTHFILSSAEQIGDRRTALDAARGLEQAIGFDSAVKRSDYRRMLASALQARLHLSSADELMALPAPDEQLQDLRLVWRLVRVHALARSGRVREGGQELELLKKERSAIELGPDLQPVVDMGVALAGARLHSQAGRHTEAAALYRRAEEMEMEAGYWEPPLWSQPAALHFGAALLRTGAPAAAADAFERALARRPGNAFALLGLAQARRAQGKIGAATAALAQFRAQWKGSPGDAHLRHF